MSLSVAYHLISCLLLSMVAGQTTGPPSPTVQSANGNLYTFTLFSEDFTPNISTSLTYSEKPFPEYPWLIDIQFAEAPVSISFASMELVAGQPTEPVPSVVDIMYVNQEPNINFTGANYALPTNMPTGYYFVRTNITYTGAKGEATDSVVSPTFYVEAIMTCRGLPPWNNVTSLSDPKYTSLHIDVPWAGQVLRLVSTSPKLAGPEFDIEWNYRDARSGEGANIQDLVMEFVQETSPSSGYYRSAGAFQAEPTSEYMNYPYNGATLDSAGLWYVRANYTPTGGSPVSHLSQPFYISSPSRPNTTCTQVCYGIGPNAPCFNNAGSVFRIPLAASLTMAGALTLGAMFLL